MKDTGRRPSPGSSVPPVARHGLVRSARALAAAALLALTGALAFPATAQADVLVSNFEAAARTAAPLLVLDAISRAQAFTVGTGNYTLTSVEVPIVTNGIGASDTERRAGRWPTARRRSWTRPSPSAGRPGPTLEAARWGLFALLAALTESDI